MLHWLNSPGNNQKTHFTKGVGSKNTFDHILNEKLNELSGYNSSISGDLLKIENELSQIRIHKKD